MKHANIFVKLKSLKQLTISEKELVTFICDNPEKFLSLKPKEISKETYVSLPTLYRLINKLGISGINDLKLEVKSSLLDKNEVTIEDVNYPILPTDTHYEAMQRLKDVYIQTINNTLDLVNPATLVKASIMMEKAEVIDVYAASANIYFAQNFQFQMQEIGALVNVPIEDYMQRLTASNSNPKHLAIIISFGGRGVAIPKVAEILKSNKTPILLITSTEKNPIMNYANQIIYMSSYENHFNKISSFSTRLTILYILDTLYANYFKRNYKKNIELKIQKHKLLSIKK